MSICEIPLGPIMCDLRGLEIETDERELLCRPDVGGVILFSRNFESVEQLERLCQSIHALRQPRLLIAVDHEGGRVQRFDQGFTRLPACALFSHADSDEQAVLLAKQAGWLMAAELLAVGVDFSFAPVLDVGGTISKVIGDRAFASTPESVSRLAMAYMHGMQEAGMAAVGKHFPGHGSVAEDSHIAMPYDRRSFAEIEQHDLIPFRSMIDAGLPALMPAHVVYPKVDRQPAGFSRFWLQQVLRQQLGFQGGIFSDDLSMAGAEGIGSYSARTTAALNAGCDIVLICNNQSGVIEALEGAVIPESTRLATVWSRMYGRFEGSLAALKKTERWQQYVEVVTKIIN